MALVLNKQLTTILFLTICFLGFQTEGKAFNTVLNDTIGYQQYKGKVIDSKTRKPLVFAAISVNGTNHSTITNTQGDFLLKVPEEFVSNSVTISFLGYTSHVIALKDLKREDNVIRLETHIEELSEVNISIKDALSLVREVLKRRGDNYTSENLSMTAFYRETIKKRRSYVSLSEAVVEVNKQPYTSFRRDQAKLFKARKSTDYNKLDTIALKLKGGPYNTLFLDIVKNPTMFLTEDMVANYDFVFDTSTKIDDRPIFVVNFKQKRFIDEPLFYGKLFIDAHTFALTSAKFEMNLDNPEAAAQIFIVKKPRGAKVTPIQANYQIDYRTSEGRWYYGYSRIELGFKINWNKKLFNSIYYSTMEMATTNWESGLTEPIKGKERLRSSVILSDEASGFSDPEFWGEYNVIEPEKPIENAIRKIQRQLRKLN